LRKREQREKTWNTDGRKEGENDENAIPYKPRNSLYKKEEWSTTCKCTVRLSKTQMEKRPLGLIVCNGFECTYV
jgi:hypothetical protein